VRELPGLTMEAETLSILRDPSLQQVRDFHFERLREVFSGEVPERPFVLCGIAEVTEDDGPGWESWLDEALGRLAAQADRAQDTRVFRPPVLNYNPHGVHFVDRLFGADVFRMEDGSWQARTLRTAVGELRPPDLDTHPTWRRAQALTAAFVQRNVPGVLFGLPTIGSALNVGVNLYGQDLILAMLTDPEAAARDLRVINDALCALHRWYRATLPEVQLQCIVPQGRCQPPGYGQLCGCTTQLLSPGLYADFVAPLDAELLCVYPHGGMIHLCGTHTQHIPGWREQPAFRAFQTNDRASEDFEVYFRELREDQILYVNPFEKVPVEAILRVTGGRRLVLPADLPEAPGATLPPG
jgi:hypothetical protein